MEEARERFKVNVTYFKVKFKVKGDFHVF